MRRGLRPPPPYPTRCSCGCAAPQRDEHKVVPGRAAPSQPLPPGGSVGKPGFPTPPLEGQALLRAGYGGTWFPHVHVRLTSLPLAHTIPLSRRKGSGGLRPRGEKWDNLVVSPPCGSAAQRRDAHTVVPGRATPSQPLPRVGVWRNPVSPDPCARAAPSHPRPRVGAWGNPVSPPSWSLFSR